MSMTEDIFAQQTFGKVALQKMGNVPDNFRLFSVGWLGDYTTTDTMEIKGAEFRAALRGKNKGELCMIVKGTERTAYVTTAEVKAFDEVSNNGL